MSLKALNLARCSVETEILSLWRLGGVFPLAIDIQIPAERVFEVGFGVPNIFSGVVWMSRAGRDDTQKKQ